MTIASRSAENAEGGVVPQRSERLRAVRASPKLLLVLAGTVFLMGCSTATNVTATSSITEDTSQTSTAYGPSSPTKETVATPSAQFTPAHENAESAAPVSAGDALADATCYNEPWTDMTPSPCRSDSYLLAGVSFSAGDWSWCALTPGLPMEAVAVASGNGVLCFLHPRELAQLSSADQFIPLVNRCLSAVETAPKVVSCWQPYSVMVTAVSQGDESCPPPRMTGVLSWAVPADDGAWVCVQRYAEKDPPQAVTPLLGPEWPADLRLPPIVRDTASPWRTGLEIAPPTWGGGAGYAVTCSDGSTSNSGGRQGACSHHGGIG